VGITGGWRFARREKGRLPGLPIQSPAGLLFSLTVLEGNAALCWELNEFVRASTGSRPFRGGGGYSTRGVRSALRRHHRAKALAHEPSRRGRDPKKVQLFSFDARWVADEYLLAKRHRRAGRNHGTIGAGKRQPAAVKVCDARNGVFLVEGPDLAMAEWGPQTPGGHLPEVGHGNSGPRRFRTGRKLTILDSLGKRRSPRIFN